MDRAKSATEAGAVSLPAGHGSVEGLGEGFSVNLNTGQASHLIALPLPQGIAGFTPTLGIEYSSGLTDGPFGFGWRVPLRQITRRSDRSHEDDRFAEGSAELFPMTDGTFRASRETGFARYERLAGGGWRILDRDGIAYELGISEAARTGLSDPRDAIDEWLIERSTDLSGNEIEYAYFKEDGVPYLKEIRYAIYAVRFIYAKRTTALEVVRGGALLTDERRCSTVELFARPPGREERKIRSWKLDYRDTATGLSLLSSLQLISHGDEPSGAGDIARNPMRFDYEGFDPQALRVRWMNEDIGPNPPTLDDPDVALASPDSSPLPGILQARDGQQLYWPNNAGHGWRPAIRLRSAPSIAGLGRAGAQLADLNGDGAADLLVATGAGRVRGYYEAGGQAGWRRFVPYPRGSSADPPWSSGRVRLLDLDADGRTDALYSGSRAFIGFRNKGPAGWGGGQPVSAGLTIPPVDLSDPLVRLADINGDGVLDLVRIRPGAIDYWPGLGGGRFGGPRRLRARVALAGALHEPERAQWVDVDGDGRADLVWIGKGYLELFLNHGGEELVPVLRRVVPYALPLTIRAADLRGTGRSGLLWNARRGRRNAYVTIDWGDAVPYRLRRVDYGSGLTRGIEYRSTPVDYYEDRKRRNPWTTNLPFSVVVVAAVSEADSVSGRASRIAYRYHDGHFSPSTRRFQGFGQVEAEEAGDKSRPPTIRRYHYHVGAEGQAKATRAADAMAGLLRRVETFASDGSALSEEPFEVEESDYGVSVLGELPDGRQRLFVHLQETRIRTRERTADERLETRAFTYDDAGNVTAEERRFSGTRSGEAVPEIVTSVRVAFARSDERNILGVPVRLTRRRADGTLSYECRKYYDGAPFEGLPLGSIERGRLTREEVLVLPSGAFDEYYAGMDAEGLGFVKGATADGEPAWFTQSQRLEYHPKGPVAARIDPTGATTRFTFDERALFCSARDDPSGTTQFEHDPYRGQLTKVIAPDGTTNSFNYDPQGRFVAAYLPGDAPGRPTRRYVYQDSKVPHSVERFALMDQASGREGRQVTYYDGAGKEVQTRTQVRPGHARVTGWSVMNGAGLVMEEYEPTFSDEMEFGIPELEGRARRVFAYDAMSRPLKVENFNGGLSTIAYAPFELILANANDTDGSPENVAAGGFGTPRIEELDAARRRIGIRETGEGGIILTTRYHYGPDGELLAYNDDRGETARYAYDLLGNRLSIHHRSAGERQLRYDAAGRMVALFDGEAVGLGIEYDSSGRTWRVRSGGEIVEEYSYDPPGAGGHGQLAQARTPHGIQQFSYTSRGSLEQVTFKVDGLEFTQRFAYDPQGREIASVYPGSERLERSYYDDGNLRQVLGIADIDYDAASRPSVVTYANGVNAELRYSSGAGRILSHRLTGPGAAVYRDRTYRYDKLEQLIGYEENTPGGESWTFKLDSLGQLQARQMAGGAAQQYLYQNGRTLSRVGEAGTELRFDDPSHPEQVTAMTFGGGLESIAYDLNGRVKTLPDRQLAWDYRGQLAKVSWLDGASATYGYDHKGRRLKRTHKLAGGETRTRYFLGDTLEIEDGKATITILAGRIPLAVIRSGTTDFLHCDYRGSSWVTTDAAGNVVGTQDMGPFGAGAPPGPGAYFALHPWDEAAGMVFMQRRWYAPELGRFLSPDPFYLYRPDLGVNDPRRLEIYNYLGNDPLDQVDPNGTDFWTVVGGIAGAAFALLTGPAGFGNLIWAAVGGYFVASKSEPGGTVESFTRGFLIGLNAGMNKILVDVMSILPTNLGTALGVINLLASVEPVAHSGLYQGVLGWSNWVMPMSWAMNGLGLTFFVIDMLFAPFTGIKNIDVDWKTGTLFIGGGLIHGSKPFNLGNFSFSKTELDQARMEHEMGHHLSLGAFGSVFHVIGALDEGGRTDNSGQSAYPERIADSNVGSFPSTVPQWSS
jgi:RHS repeat-associated protein